MGCGLAAARKKKTALAFFYANEKSYICHNARLTDWPLPTPRPYIWPRCADKSITNRRTRAWRNQSSNTLIRMVLVEEDLNATKKKESDEKNSSVWVCAVERARAFSRLFLSHFPCRCKLRCTTNIQTNNIREYSQGQKHHFYFGKPTQTNNNTKQQVNNTPTRITQTNFSSALWHFDKEGRRNLNSPEHCFLISHSLCTDARFLFIRSAQSELNRGALNRLSPQVVHVDRLISISFASSTMFFFIIAK